MKKDNSKKNVIINITIVTMLLLIFFVSLINKHDLIYTMNDDIALKAISSGKYSGEPAFHMIFSGFPYSTLLIFLYNITDAIDWYGLILISSMIFFLGYTIYNIIKKEENILKKIIYTIFIFIILLIVFNVFFVEITFTSVSSFVAACCLILYLLPDSKAKNIIMTIGIVLSFGIRMKSCLMILVFFIPALFYKNYKDKENLKKDFILGIKIGAILLICFIIEKSFYTSTEYKEYLKYNELRSLYYDYYYGEFINYPIEKNMETYKKAGFDDTEMQLLHTYGGIGFYEDIPQKLEKLIEQCKETMTINVGIEQTIKELIKKPQNMYYCITLILIALAIITSPDKKKKLITILPFIAFQLLILGYLIIGGRIPDRVMVPLYTCYIVTNIYIILKTESVRNIIDRILNCNKALILIPEIIMLVLIMNATIESVSIPFGRKANVMEAYFNEHSENYYIYDNNELERFKIFNKFNGNRFINMSGWTVYSPEHKKAIKNQGANSLKELLFKDNVYMILDATCPIEDYKAIEPNAKIEKVDTIENLNVYKFTK